MVTPRADLALICNEVSVYGGSESPRYREQDEISLEYTEPKMARNGLLVDQKASGRTTA